MSFFNLAMSFTCLGMLQGKSYNCDTKFYVNTTHNIIIFVVFLCRYDWVCFKTGNKVPACKVSSRGVFMTLWMISCLGLHFVGKKTFCNTCLAIGSLRKWQRDFVVRQRNKNWQRKRKSYTETKISALIAHLNRRRFSLACASFRRI